MFSVPVLGHLLAEVVDLPTKLPSLYMGLKRVSLDNLKAILIVYNNCFLLGDGSLGPVIMLGCGDPIIITTMAAKVRHRMITMSLSTLYFIK
jgi:hypothetical protein